MRGFGASALKTASHPFGENAVEPVVELRAQAGEGRDLAPQVGAELGGEGVGRRVEKELWPLFRSRFLALEEAIDVAARGRDAQARAPQGPPPAGPPEL